MREKSCNWTVPGQFNWKAQEGQAHVGIVSQAVHLRDGYRDTLTTS